MFIQDIHFVDLKNSSIDEKATDREKGKYAFKKKVYLRYKHNPDYYLAWCRYTPHTTPPYADMWEWETRWGYTPVTTADNYWPEGVPPNADGKYVNGDTILMKVPMIDHLKRRAGEIAASENASKGILNQFRNESRAMGVDLDEATLQGILSGRSQV
jgi:hypothetical protein